MAFHIEEPELFGLRWRKEGQEVTVVETKRNCKRLMKFSPI